MSLIAAASTEPWINFSALWKILVVGLLAGAGLPTVFAVGLRALNYRSGATVDGDDTHVYGGNPAGLAAGGFCFLVVLAAIGWGIYFIVHSS